MICNITNKKYQRLKIFLNVNETIILGPKETKKFNIVEVSEHLKDLENEGSISIKKIG